MQGPSKHQMALSLREDEVTRVPLGVGIIDRELRYIEVNQPLAAMHELSVEEHVGRPLAAVIPNLAPLIEPLLRHVLETGEPLRDIEVRGELHDGRSGRWLASYEPVRTRSGTVLAVECVVRELDADAPDTALTTTQAALQTLAEQLSAERRRTERALQSAEAERALLDTLLGSAPIGFDFVDADLRFVRINDYLANNNGIPVAEHLGRTVREVLPQLADAVEPLLRQVLTTGLPIIDIEVTGETSAAPGVPRIWRESLYPVFDKAGQILGVGAIVAEITEHRRISAALRESQERLRQNEERFQLALRGTPVTIWNQDRSLRYTWVYNPPPALPAEQLLGRSDAELFEGTPQGTQLTSIKQQVLATGQGARYEMPTPLDGQLAIYDVIIEPLRDDEGAIVGLVGTAIDVTARHSADTEQARLLKIAEAAAARTATLQAITAALAPALTPLQVAEVVVTRCADALGARSGVLALIDPTSTTLEAIYAQGYPDGDLAKWRWPMASRTPMTDAVRGGYPVLVRNRDEAELHYPDLAAVRAGLPDVAWANLPLRTEQGMKGALSLGFSTAQAFDPDDRALLQAIAQQCAQALERARLYEGERIAREQAERAVRERDDLIALISHDLKNPLTVIQGQAQLMERRLARGETLETARVERGLGLVREAAIRMSVQIEELLDVAVLRAGRSLHLDLQPLDLIDIAERAFGLSQAHSEQHSMRLMTPETALICQCDGPRIERVISNLLSNAIKYTPEGRGIELAVRREERDGRGWAVLEVSDQGIGIPAADLPHIFERFHRAANTVGQIHGTGLGLASAQQIVEQHGGCLGVHSVEGEGSVFTVWLPL